MQHSCELSKAAAAFKAYINIRVQLQRENCIRRIVNRENRPYNLFLKLLITSYTLSNRSIHFLPIKQKDCTLISDKYAYSDAIASAMNIAVIFFKPVATYTCVLTVNIACNHEEKFINSWTSNVNIEVTKLITELCIRSNLQKYYPKTYVK